MVYPKHRITQPQQDANLFKATVELCKLEETLRLKTAAVEEREKKVEALQTERNEYKDAYMEQMKKREADLKDYIHNQRMVEQCYQAILLKEKTEYQRLVEHFNNTVKEKDKEIKRLEGRAAQFEKELDINEEDTKKLWKKLMDEQDVVAKQEEIIKQQTKVISAMTRKTQLLKEQNQSRTTKRTLKRASLGDGRLEHLSYKNFCADRLPIGSDMEQAVGSTTSDEQDYGLITKFSKTQTVAG